MRIRRLSLTALIFVLAAFAWLVFPKSSFSAVAGAEPLSPSLERADAPSLNAPGESRSPAASQGAITFTHGIASGDVTSSTAVLWTRLQQTATITAEVALDADFTELVFQGAVTTSAASDYTAKVLATSLSPSQLYSYRWVSQDGASQTGTFKTALAGSDQGGVRFAFSGDSDGTKVDNQPLYNNFEVLDAAREEDLDFFIYLGDTVYPENPAALEDYRSVYRVNRTYAALRNLFASTSSYVLWDDHEVWNDYDGETIDPFSYTIGRQAFMEYMPVQERVYSIEDPTCAGDPQFRVVSWGDQLDFFILDERSCRSQSVDQYESGACLISIPFVGDFLDPAPTLSQEKREELISQFIPSTPQACLDAIHDPSRTMLGETQKQLFKDALLASSARYKFVVNELPIQQIYIFPYDRWEGYAAERAEILDFIRSNTIENVIFLTTDIHANIMNEVFIDNEDDKETIAYEFITGPIAATTLEDALSSMDLPIDPIPIMNDLIAYVGIDCRRNDTYAYGLVDLDAGGERLTVSLRDSSGAVLQDEGNPSALCSRTMGVSHALFLPLVVR